MKYEYSTPIITVEDLEKSDVLCSSMHDSIEEKGKDLLSSILSGELF